ASAPGAKIFGAVSRHGTPWGKGISENVIWYVVRRGAERMQLDHLAPHDLRRTCAKLCHMNGGELGQIQVLLDHFFVLTTLVGVVLAMAAVGLLATWIPAQRALSVNPLILLRED